MSVYKFSENQWIRELNKKLDKHWLVDTAVLDNKDSLVGDENGKDKSEWIRLMDFYLYDTRTDLDKDQKDLERKRLISTYKSKDLNEENLFIPMSVDSLQEKFVQMAYIATNHKLENLSPPYFFKKDMADIFDLYNSAFQEFETKYRKGSVTEEEKISLLYFIFKMKYRLNKFAEYLESQSTFNDFANMREVNYHDTPINEKHQNLKRGTDYFYLFKKIAIIVDEIRTIKNFHADVQTLLKEFVEEYVFKEIPYDEDIFHWISENEVLIEFRKLPWLRDIERLPRARRAQELLALRDVIEDLECGYKIYSSQVNAKELKWEIEVIKKDMTHEMIFKDVFENLKILEKWKEQRNNAKLAEYEMSCLKDKPIFGSFLKVTRQEESAEMYFQEKDNAINYIKSIKRENKLLNMMNPKNINKNIGGKGKV